jgi:hypothetical protein
VSGFLWILLIGLVCGNSSDRWCEAAAIPRFDGLLDRFGRLELIFGDFPPEGGEVVGL